MMAAVVVVIVDSVAYHRLKLYWAMLQATNKFQLILCLPSGRCINHRGS